MRNLNECRAEVFRRSEKRIKERRQRRNHILMVCIPLVLCITISGAWIFSLNLTDKSAAPENTNEHYADGTEAAQDGLGGLFAGSVEVSGNGLSHSYGSVEDVQRIVGLINEIVAVPETNAGAENGDFTVEDSTTTDLQGDHKENGYEILVKRNDGSSTEYLLVGLMLIDQTTQEEFHMSEDTCKDLKDALGILRK